jgi:hypothetical protein
MNIFVLFILGYLLYRFIGGFLVPLFRTTSQMRRQFHEMNGQPPAGSQKGNQTTGTDPAEQAHAPKSESSKVGEYIDFEEVVSKPKA